MRGGWSKHRSTTEAGTILAWASGGNSDRGIVQFKGDIPGGVVGWVQYRGGTAGTDTSCVGKDDVAILEEFARGRDEEVG